MNFYIENKTKKYIFDKQEKMFFVELELNWIEREKKRQEERFIFCSKCGSGGGGLTMIVIFWVLEKIKRIFVFFKLINEKKMFVFSLKFMIKINVEKEKVKRNVQKSIKNQFEFSEYEKEKRE